MILSVVKFYIGLLFPLIMISCMPGFFMSAIVFYALYLVIFGVVLIHHKGEWEDGLFTFACLTIVSFTATSFFSMLANVMAMIFKSMLIGV